MNHEPLRSFSGPSGESLRKAGFQRFFKVEGGTGNLLVLGNQIPLLFHASLGRGRLYLFASSADMDWNDLPLNAAYLPLVQGLLKETVRSVRGSPANLAGKGRTPGLAGPGGEGEEGTQVGQNPPFKESDLTKVTPEELKKRFGTLPLNLLEYREGILGEGHRGRRELWPFLLLFLLMVLGVEMVAANWIPKEKSQPDQERWIQGETGKGRVS